PKSGAASRAPCDPAPCPRLPEQTQDLGSVAAHQLDFILNQAAPAGLMPHDLDRTQPSLPRGVSQPGAAALQPWPGLLRLKCRVEKGHLRVRSNVERVVDNHAHAAAPRTFSITPRSVSATLAIEYFS